MAEVRKRKTEDKYKLEKIKEETTKKEKKKKTETKTDPRAKNKETKSETKKSLFVRFRIFCHGVKSEFDKVHWTTKDKMVKYSIMVVVFILAMSAFFYLIDVIFAFIQSLFN